MNSLRKLWFGKISLEEFPYGIFVETLKHH